MASENAYLIIDIGTGNVRVAATNEDGKILGIERDNVHYEKDALYPDALYFNPDTLWDQILKLSIKVLSRTRVDIKAITVSSQREGIVLVDAHGNNLIGLPNHDHRGREWEGDVQDMSRIYALSGRYPSSLFSALKVIGIKKKRHDLFKQLNTILSISDWAQFRLTGVLGYEHSQASETQLYDVAERKWSKELCTLFGLSEKILPPLHESGSIQGKLLPEIAKILKISVDAIVVVGGADTQLAIKSTRPAVDDIVIVSGTTTPIVKIIPEYIVDQKERTWTNRHVDKDSFILEANAGVTGLNYQRLKEIFYPNEGYEVIEEELHSIPDSDCVASLGSLIAEEKKPLTKGGFIFEVPVSNQLTRATFVRATLWDIACCIKENYDCLIDVAPYNNDYLWACGGGFQSRMLCQFVANLINKKVQVRDGFQQASVTGGTVICNETLKTSRHVETPFQSVNPQDPDRTHELYKTWKSIRGGLKKIF